MPRKQPLDVSTLANVIYRISLYAVGIQQIIGNNKYIHIEFFIDIVQFHIQKLSSLLSGSTKFVQLKIGYPFQFFIYVVV